MLEGFIAGIVSNAKCKEDVYPTKEFTLKSLIVDAWKNDVSIMYGRVELGYTVVAVVVI